MMDSSPSNHEHLPTIISSPLMGEDEGGGGLNMFPPHSFPLLLRGRARVRGEHTKSTPTLILPHQGGGDYSWQIIMV